MANLGPAAIVAGVILLVFVGMWAGWRRLQRRDASLRPLTALPADLGTQFASVDALYVATTAAGRPLERLAIRGLGFRAFARVDVHAAGVVLALKGAATIFIPAGQLLEVAPATVAIDRVVERDGLIRLGWLVPGSGPTGNAERTPVDSYLRVVDPERSLTLFRVLQASVAAATDRSATHLGSEA